MLFISNNSYHQSGTDFYSIKAERFNHHSITFMIRWSLGFFAIAVIAAALGFGGIADGAASIAKVIFFVFIVLFILSLFFKKSSAG